LSHLESAVTRYSQLPPDKVDGLLYQCCQSLDALALGLGSAGGRLLAEHGPGQCPVEWHPPWWLAATLDLAEADWRALTVCSGLAEFAASLQSEADLGWGRLADAARGHLQQAVVGVLHV
jgi:hypothetical protein